MSTLFYKKKRIPIFLYRYPQYHFLNLMTLIYARLLLYNFCQRIVQDIKIIKKKTKYTYQINFTRASHIIRRFLNKKTGKKSPVENLIAKEILPVRPGRTSTRHVSAKKVVCFNYRFD